MSIKTHINGKGFLLPTVLILLFVLMVLSAGLIYTGANATRYVVESEVENKEEQCISESHVYWKGELESGKYTQDNPQPAGEYIATPILGSTVKMIATFGPGESMNRPLPSNPAFSPDKIPSVGYQEKDRAAYTGYDNTWIPMWHCFISLESSRKKRYQTMLSGAFPYGAYAPRGSVSLTSARSYSNPTADKAEQADWKSIVNQTGLPLNILAQDDIVVDDYPHGYASSLRGTVRIANKNGAIGLRQKEALPDYSMKYEADITNAFDSISDVTMDKSNFLKGAPLKYGLFVGLIYSTTQLIYNPDDPLFACLFSVEQAAAFPFLVIPTIKERFGGLIWEVYMHYPDTPDRFLPPPEDPKYADELAKYEKIQEMLDRVAAIEYCWLNPGVDPNKEEDWQKRYLMLDQLCPEGAYYGESEFMKRQGDLDNDVLKVIMKNNENSKYDDRPYGKAIQRRHWTEDDAKEISHDFLRDKLVKVYTGTADLRYEIQYKNSKDDDWVKTDYHYTMTNVETSFNRDDNPSNDKVEEELEDEAKDRGKDDDLKDQLMVQYQNAHGKKYDIKISDPKDVSVYSIQRKGGGSSLYFSQKSLYDSKAFRHHKNDIWPGSTDTLSAWKHMHQESLDKDKWYEHKSLFDREMYLKYGILLDLSEYMKDEDFPDKPTDSHYDNMSLLTERGMVPKTVHGEPEDLHGIAGCNYGKLVWHFFRGLYSSFTGLAKAIVKGDPWEFFASLEKLFEENRRVVHFRGIGADMMVTDNLVTIKSDWTVPRGRTLRLKGDLGVIGDVWIQDGATLYIEGNLAVVDEEKLKNSSSSSSSSTTLKSAMKGGTVGLSRMMKSVGAPKEPTPEKPGEQKLAEDQINEMAKGKEDYFKPSGRVFLGKGSNLLVGGDFYCMGSPEKGSVLVDSEIGDITYVSSSIISKGNVEIPYGILPSMSPSSLSTYFGSKGLKDWKKFLRDVELLPSQVAKVAGPFEARLCCFARYPDPITILDLGFIIIPFPSFYSLRTNMNIGIFRGLTLAYSLMLNGALGENLFTDSRWWALLREDKLYSETKKPDKEELEEFLYSKEGEKVVGGVPVFPKIGGRMALEKCVEVFPGIPVTDMSGFAMNARFCLEITMFDKIMKVLFVKLVEEIFKEIFSDLFEGGELLKEFGDKMCEKISEMIANVLFSGTLDEYMKSLVACNPAPAVITLGIASNVYMKSKGAELTTILKSKPDYLINETSGVLIYAGKKLKIGDSDQKTGSCVFAPGLFVANGDIEIYADRTVGSMISVNGSIAARNFHYYPYFTRASLNRPAKYKSPIWQYMKEFFVTDEDNYKSSEPPMEIGEKVYHTISEGWNK